VYVSVCVFVCFCVCLCVCVRVCSLVLERVKYAIIICLIIFLNEQLRVFISVCSYCNQHHQGRNPNKKQIHKRTTVL